MNNLALRAVSGTLYVALIICSLIFSDLLFCILCVIFGVLAIVEFDNLTSLAKGPDGKAMQGEEPSLGMLSTDVYGLIALTLPCVGIFFFNNFSGMFVYFVLIRIIALCTDDLSENGRSRKTSGLLHARAGLYRRGTDVRAVPEPSERRVSAACVHTYMD